MYILHVRDVDISMQGWIYIFVMYEGIIITHDYWVQGYIAGSTGYDILTLIGVATDIYSKLSFDDTDCQKKIICEFMEEPDMFGKHYSVLTLLISQHGWMDHR